MTNLAYQFCKFMKKGFLISFLFFLIMIFGVSSCSDLQKESSNSACNTALDNQDFDTAISVCTSSKGLGDAYMGKGGFTITNLLNNSGGESTPSYITSKSSNLGTVDDNAAKILYIIGTAQSQVSDNSTRASNIQTAKYAFDNASEKYKGIIASDKDAALMYTFANVFRMQLGQVLYYDAMNYACNASSTDCSSGNKYADGSTTGSNNYDGYIFPEDQQAKRLSYGTGANGIKSTCEGMSSTMTYITNITDGLTKSAASTSGSSTSLITSSKTAVCTTLSTLKTACLTNTSCQTACTASDC